jgi:hypothetical protein
MKDELDAYAYETASELVFFNNDKKSLKTFSKITSLYKKFFGSDSKIYKRFVKKIHTFQANLKDK